jgi:hypothetical protein
MEMRSLRAAPHVPQDFRWLNRAAGWVSARRTDERCIDHRGFGGLAVPFGFCVGPRPKADPTPQFVGIL